ncbi:MAG: DUF4173 domain-containing protein [Clostridiales Family XIII bacterium]|jgi:hypothetical protein|nr:DUF4173 domain-containing protein [Clostridiales Family XIII bacterium]
MNNREYTFEKGDGAFAVFMLVCGFLFWEWLWPKSVPGTEGQYFDYNMMSGDLTVAPGLGVSLLIYTLAAAGLVYMRVRGHRQTARSLPWLCALAAGALPFLLYQGTIGMHILLFFFEAAVFLVWLATTCGTTVGGRLSGLVFFDGLAQLFPVAFGNFTGLFRGLRDGTKEREGSRRTLTGALGILIALPVICGVVALLYAADEGFAALARSIAETLRLENLGRYLIEAAVGVPVACYLYGAFYGNTHGRRTGAITEEGIARSLAKAHRIPAAAVTAPVAVLCGFYVLFFIGMGRYLFSAFAGDLPDAYSYAEYARKGFFELCGVAAINLGVLAFTWWFAKRGQAERPKRLCAFGGILSALTILLVLTAMSKMMLYIGEYGLTRMRVHTFWFMILLLCVFAALFVWHLRAYNAGRPIVCAAVALVLALFLANTDGVVARYNVDGYLSGKCEGVDMTTLFDLSDAKYASLARLAEEAPDPAVRSLAVNYLRGVKVEVPLRDVFDGSSYLGLVEPLIYNLPYKALEDESVRIPYMAWNRESSAAAATVAG